MNQLTKLTGKIILVLLSSAYLTACTGGAANSSFGSTAAGGGSAIDEVPGGMSDGIDEATKFYVGLDSSINDVAHVHLEEDFSSKCSIDPTSTLQDKVCIMDTPEAELYMHGLKMMYNVPPGMCRYLARETYWYYNFDVGFGPGSITVNQTISDGVVTGATCSFNGGATGSCNASIEAYVNAAVSPPVITCVYDHTLAGGTNGCLGSYFFTLNTTNTVTTTVPPTVTNSTASSAVSWGGSVAPLIGGAARRGWTLGNNGYPVRIYTPAHLGVPKEAYTIPAPVTSISLHTTMELANYSTPALNTHDGYTSATVSDFPYALAPIDDFSGSSIPTGNDSYLFDCIDQAHEILHRMKVYVREWDTYQDYFDYITSKGVTEIPDRRAGLEGTTCTGLDGPCNDYIDLDDMAAFWVSYTTNVPASKGDTNFSRRQGYFPSIP